ncbi:MAG: Na+:solute symporter [Candidatus Omnitrophica bacterium]|nr:Na+:solute symporter [Candidatus Omnitrophota bacterium]
MLDWIVVATYCLASLWLGLALTKRASSGIESYFASERKLGWLLAGTSMAATAFSSDTPLLVTGIVRQKGIWGNWEIWVLAISTMFTVFFFSKLWKRAGVLTEVELVELRYSGRPAAFLRGFKAIYWGILYNAFIMGAWPVTGLVKVMQETTDLTKAQAIFFCMGLTAIYAVLSGFWGVVLTDFFQFFIALAGAFILAFASVRACGGLGNLTAELSATGKLDFIPPVSGENTAEFLASPFGWFLGLVLIQWWAWKNTDGGGIIVQRIASCKNEKQAIWATLWFNIAQYALRSWPWIITALASLILLPDLTDHERAYPRLIPMLLPAGLRGFMVASFFAAFMSTMSTHLNWGSSYFVSDFYKRFVKREESEAHYVAAGRLTSIGLALIAAGVAFYTESIGQVFTFVLNLTAAIGPVYFLRWFWWRINPWSEIAAMAVSVPVILFRPAIFRMLNMPDNLIMALFIMVAGSALFWVPVTLLTRPAGEEKLRNFYSRVRPPGIWKNWGPSDIPLKSSLLMWVYATAALLLTAAGPLKVLLGEKLTGSCMCIGAAVLWFIALRSLGRESFVAGGETKKLK